MRHIEISTHESRRRPDTHPRARILTVVQHVDESDKLVQSSSELARELRGCVYILPVRLGVAFADPSAVFCALSDAAAPLDATWATKLVDVKTRSLVPTDILPPCFASRFMVTRVAEALQVGTVVVSGTEPPPGRFARSLVAIFGDLASTLSTQQRNWDVVVVG